MSVEDVYHNKIENVKNVTSVYTSACYEKCAEQHNGAAFFSIPEGHCFRNCITKFNTWFPSLKTNLSDAPFHFHEKKLHEHLMEKDANYLRLNTDSLRNCITKFNTWFP